ncbi:MAG: HPF/RaiA family ribosome-associated protein [Rhodocyclaceae bacterium]
MQITIHAHNLALDDSIRPRVERRALSALSRLETHIRRLAVHIEDINGPRGGVDKRCVVQVQLMGTAPVVIQETGSDLPSVVDRALTRAGHTVGRNVERTQKASRTRRGWLKDLATTLGGERRSAARAASPQATHN